MATKARKGGKSGRKHGRAGRKPATAKRKFLRPDLGRKFKNVLRSCGIAFARRWVKDKTAKGENVLKYAKLLERR